jgi:hypothetical protein
MVATGTGYVPITQTAKPQMPAAKLAKFDANHQPGGNPDGGQFAPDGEGGALDSGVYHPGVDPGSVEEAASPQQQPPSHNAAQVHQAVLTALRLLSPGRDPSGAVQSYQDNFAKVTNRDAIDTTGWHSAITIENNKTAMESPPLPGYPEYALKMYKDPSEGYTIAVTYVTGSASHDAFAIPFMAGKPVNAAIAGFFLMAVNQRRWPK